VCYGLGGVEPTVSDANIVLGYLNENYFLGGRMRLDKQAALAAIKTQIAQPLGIDETKAASGIHRIATAHMSDLIRKATVERGHDPRHFALFAYGGAAPIHASRYAAQLGVTKVIVPLTASVHGATGLISSDVVYDYGKSDHLIVPVDLARVNENFSGLVKQAVRDLRNAGFASEDIKIARSLDMRYRYQVHELNVPFPTGTGEITADDMEQLYTRFDLLYEKAYGQGSAYRDAGREIITFRVTAIGELQRPRIESASAQEADAQEALKVKRDVYFEEYGKFVPTAVYDFERLTPNGEISGPAIVETPVTTVVVNPRDRAVMDEFRNIIITTGG
jgi:N-methylhydantoinase A